uniref:Uncharacterized protein n=1 Tax=Panagrolaimus sp. ES5 TaxID=591445 RepID=A0AC34G2X9_9BILA
MNQSNKNTKSQPKAVGKDMAASWKGDRNNEGDISSNYQGRPGNVIPGYNPHTLNNKPVSEWTHDRMKKYRDDAKEKREAEQKK